MGRSADLRNWMGFGTRRNRGGIDIFAERRDQSAAKDRVVTAEEVVAREPDLIIGSWCGKKFRPERVATRAGFDRLPAVQHQDLYEIKSSLILQPGPAALTDGLAELEKIIRRWAGLLALIMRHRVEAKPMRPDTTRTVTAIYRYP